MDADDRPPTPDPLEAPLTPDDIAPLLDNLADPDRELRIATLSALVALPLSTDAWLAVSDKLARLLRAEATPDPVLLETAVRVPTLQIRGLLHSLVESIAELAGRRDVVHALARARAQAAIPPLLEDFRADDIYVQSTALEFLSFFAVPTAHNEFVHLAASDPDTDIRFWSAICLAQLDEPESLAHLLTSPDATSSLTFMWGDPAFAFARIEGRGPWPAVTRGMLERLTGEDSVIVEALLSGFDEISPDRQPDAPLSDQTPAEVDQLREHALALRDQLDVSFPNDAHTGEWDVLAFLPEGDGASLISR
ncbi:MAG: hypothetical protein H0T93_11445, partial [Chloroflexia bacterium]|nr:hypothetical protein [Chloroflexia bacterium]